MTFISAETYQVSSAPFPPCKGQRTLAKASGSRQGYWGLRPGYGLSTPAGGCLPMGCFCISLNIAMGKHCVPSNFSFTCLSLLDRVPSFSHYTDFWKGSGQVQLLCWAGRPFFHLCQFKKWVGIAEKWQQELGLWSHGFKS